MFNEDMLRGLFEGDRDTLCVSSDSKYALYKLNREQVYEFRLELIRSDIPQLRLREIRLELPETLTRFYLPSNSKTEDIIKTLRIILRNCLLIERKDSE